MAVSVAKQPYKADQATVLDSTMKFETKVTH